MSKLKDIDLTNIRDEVIRENFKKIMAYGEEQAPFKNFKFIEVKFEKAISNRKVAHNLGFLPKDVLITSKSGNATVTLHHDLFTNSDINISSDGECEVRLLAGSF